MGIVPSGGALVAVATVLPALLLPPAGSPDPGAATEAPGQDVPAVGDTLEDIAAEATRAVVLVEVRTRSGGRQGSGFIVDSTGRILTNQHVIANARSILVKDASGDVYDRVSLLAVDERRDIAVLQIPGFDLPSLVLGNSDSVRVGSQVIAIGSPLGLENTVSTGIVSGRRQEPEGYQVLQISAPASQGSSGGPVMSRRGEVVGIAVSQLRNGQNLNFAIPINYARGILQHLHGEPIAVLEPAASPRRPSSSTDLAGAEQVNGSLRFELADFEGYHIELEGRSGETRESRTRITYRRIDAVGDREARIERYRESETTERSGPFGTPQIVRRERSRTIVGAEGLRPVSAQGETTRWTGEEWVTSSYNLRFEDYRAWGTIVEQGGNSESVDRELPPGILLRGMRDLAFASLLADSLIGRSVEFVTFDPATGELANDRYDVRDTATVRFDGRTYEVLVVNVASGLSNSTSYFRRDRPRVLLRRSGGDGEDAEIVVDLELHGVPAAPDSAAAGNPSPPPPGEVGNSSPMADGATRGRGSLQGPDLVVVKGVPPDMGGPVSRLHFERGKPTSAARSRPAGTDRGRVGDAGARLRPAQRLERGCSP